MNFNKIIPEFAVTNLKNSINFYKTCGFKIEYDRPENKFAFLSLDTIQFMLQEISKDDKWELAPLSYPFGNGINFQLEVKDTKKNWYRQNGKLLGCREFLVQDPDGYLLRFSEDLGERDV